MSNAIVQYDEKINEDDKKLYYWAPEGDKDNLVYGELYKMKIPNYQPSPSRCLGLQANERVIYDRRERIYISFKQGESNGSSKPAERYCSPPFSKLLRKPSRKLISKPSRRLLYPSFVPFIVPTNEQQVYEEKEEQQGEEAILFQRNKYYNERTREEPHNEALWHEFIHFQDEFHAGINHLQGGNKDTFGALALLEKKRSIYLEALQLNPESISLLTGYISCCQQLWDKDRVIALWNSTMSSKSENVELWNLYLDFLQSNFGYFTVGETRSVFLRAILAMHSLKLRAERSSNFEGVYYLEEKIVDFVGRLCVFEHQAGYSERAVGLYQAMIELNCFGPMGLFDFKSKIKAFKEFWNNEYPRIGEINAKGWAFYHTHPPSSSHPSSHPSSIPPPPSDDLSSLLQYEHMQSASQWKPCYSYEHSEHQDVDSIVLFDDIKEFLLPILSKKLQEKLIVNFIELMITTDRGKYHTTRLRLHNEGFKESSNADLLWLSSIEQIGPDLYSYLPSHLDLVLPSPPLSDDLSPPFFSLFSRPIAPHLLSDSRIAFIRNVVELTKGLFGEGGEIYSIGMNFESQYASSLRFAINPPERKQKLEVKRRCKALLQHTSDLLSFLTFSKIEQTLSSSDDAKRVVDITLSMVSDPKQKKRSEYQQLYHLYITIELESATTPEQFDIVKKKILHLIVCYLNDTFTSLLKPPEELSLDVSPTSLLRARRAIEERIKAGREGFARERAAMYFENHMWLLTLSLYFEYINKGLPECLSTLHDALSLPWPSDYYAEQLYITGTRIIKTQMKFKKGTAPHVLRDVLYKAMKLYPSNPYFLSQFVEHEATSHLDNRLRRFFDDACKKQTSPVIWLFAIKSETCRLGSSHRIISLFEKALSIKEISKCPAMWRNYIEFHRAKGEIEAAKRIYYRAIRAVPFSKMLWLDCLRLQFAPIELKQIINLMIEKDIRLHFDSSLLPPDDDGDDEVEAE